MCEGSEGGIQGLESQDIIKKKWDPQGKNLRNAGKSGVGEIRCGNIMRACLWWFLRVTGGTGFKVSETESFGRVLTTKWSQQRVCVWSRATAVGGKVAAQYPGRSRD